MSKQNFTWKNLENLRNFPKAAEAGFKAMHNWFRKPCFPYPTTLLFLFSYGTISVFRNSTSSNHIGKIWDCQRSNSSFCIPSQAPPPQVALKSIPEPLLTLTDAHIQDSKSTFMSLRTLGGSFIKPSWTQSLLHDHPRRMLEN